MSDSSVLPVLVSGPHQVPGRELVVNAGWLAVLFRNGVPSRVCRPGRHSAVTGLFTGRRLPMTGELTVMLFDSAPRNVRMAADAVRLADARKIGVSAVAVVRPRWCADPESLLDIVARYGVLSARYGEAAEHQLDADFRAWARQLLRERDHDDVYLAYDSRTALAGPSDVSGGALGPGNGLLYVERFVDVEVTPDPVVVSIEQVKDKVEIDVFRHQAKAALVPLKARLDKLRAMFEDRLTRAREVHRAETDVDVAAVYGVIPLFMREPEAATEVVKTRWEALNRLLSEYADMLPFAAEELGVTPTELLQSMAQGRIPAGGRDGDAPAPDEIGRLDDRRRPA
ncbi:hypothetical protein ACIHFC_11365 [Streptomyces sp. NPDC052013]|uniref:hypothetical protein n=1 Tax=Streptomyces sp. NPDC052013 TaxID=3365679 RepID=UPI0037CE4655